MHTINPLDYSAACLNSVATFPETVNWAVVISQTHTDILKIIPFWESAQGISKQVLFTHVVYFGFREKRTVNLRNFEISARCEKKLGSRLVI